MHLSPRPPRVDRPFSSSRFVAVERRKPRRTARPRLEALEDRLAPALLTVNTLQDESTSDAFLSLREAIAAVNSHSTAGLSTAEKAQISGSLGINDTIVFSVTGTITLTAALPALAAGVTIQGPGATQLSISGAQQFRVLVVNSGVTAALNGLTITNGSSLSGGGIDNSGMLTVSNCTFSANTAATFGAGGGIENSGTLTVISSIFSANSGGSDGAGGGIENLGILTVSNSTFSANSAGFFGGGIYNNGILTVSNSTFSANSAAQGGGVYNDDDGMLTVSNSTFSSNSAAEVGGGFLSRDSGSITLRNTLVADNNGDDVNGAVTAVSAFNLIGNGVDLTGISNGSNGNLIGSASAPINPLLAPLGDYGGPTQTLALLPGSPALGAGDPSQTGADQRGLPRSRSGVVDIGAFESRGFTLAFVGGDNQTATADTVFAAPLVVQAASAFGEPIQGGAVTFTGPATGAGLYPAVFAAAIGAGGQASLVAVANGAAGAYQVTATASGAVGSAAFHLTNLPGPPPSPAVLTVNTLQDEDAPDNFLSLREAIQAVDTGYIGNLSAAERAQIKGLPGVGGTPTIVFSVTGTLTLQSALPAVTAAVTIQGPGATQLAINGADKFQVLVVNSGVTATLDGLTITNGSSDFGGGIDNSGMLTVSNCTFSANASATFGAGGGIENSGTLTVISSIFSANSGGSNGDGGGIDNNGMLTVSNSTFSANSAGFEGGGIYNKGMLTVSNSTFTANSAGLGGGIYYNSGMLTVSNSTFSGNSAEQGGGIGENNFSGASTITLRNTLVADNNGDDVYGAVTAASAFNLIGNGVDLTGISNGSNGNLIGSASAPINPLLDPLGDYGGPTQTQGLLPGSPALGAGDPAQTGADQRGLPRSRSGVVDIGAFESRGFTLAFVSGDNQTATAESLFAAPLVVQVASAFGEPIQRGAVTFTGPATGAGLYPAVFTAAIGAGGQASLVAVANGAAGAYQVTATASGAIGSAVLHLTNLPGPPPSPAVLTVNTLQDEDAPDNFLSLREAIQAVDTGYIGNLSAAERLQIKGLPGVGGTPTIVFSVTGTITLQSALPALAATVTIQGPGAAQLAINGADHFQVLVVNSGVTATLDGLTITHGSVAIGSGAGVANNGTLTISNSVISRNSASGSASGGGLANTGTLTLLQCSINSNSARGAFSGAGGGVVNSGTLVVNDCTFTNNAAAGVFASGGGIANSGALTLTNSTFSGNQASAGGSPMGSNQSEGGGVSTGGTGVTLTATNCTFSGNSASNAGEVGDGSGGGGISAGGTLLTLVNCTFSGNQANAGGGVDDGSVTALIVSCTFSGNSVFSFPPGGHGSYSPTPGVGGGIASGSGTLILRSTIVAGNLSEASGGSATGSDISGMVAAASAYNLIGDGAGLSGITNGSNRNAIGTSSAPLDPKLGPLADNGGPTQTMAVGPGSPAFFNGAPDAPPTDQRGAPRPGVPGELPDIGAYQYRLPTVSVAYGPIGEVVVVVTQTGNLIQYDANGIHKAYSGVSSASVAFGPSGEVVAAVFANGALVQFDAAGPHFLYSNVRFATITFGPAGQILDVVFQNGFLYQFDSSGAHPLMGNVYSADAAVGPAGEVLDVIFQDGSDYQFDAAGAHFLFSGAIGMDVTFTPTGQEVVNAVFQSGAEVQFTNGVGVLLTSTAIGVPEAVFDSTGREAIALIFQGDVMMLFDANGLHPIPSF